MLTDRELLERLLSDEYVDRLFIREEEAFQEMLERKGALSPKQSAWVRSAAERFGIQEAPAANVFSSMTLAKRNENLAQVRTRLPWETVGYVKALRPPGK